MQRPTAWPPPPPPSPTLVELLATLPPEVLSLLLSQAGIHTRQVCRAYHALHPPLLDLAPHSIASVGELLAALPTLPTAVTSLDLSGCHPDAITSPPTQLAAALAAALPNLQKLELPSMDPELPPAILQACPRLHTLLAPDGVSSNLSSSGAVSWAPLWDPSIATRLRCLALPLQVLEDASPLPSLPKLTKLVFPSEAAPRMSLLNDSHLRSLSAAAPSLHGLVGLELPPNEHFLASIASLTTFTSLQELGVRCYYTGAGSVCVEPLQLLGTLTALRSLSLCQWTSAAWQPVNARWLACLTQLTSLSIAVLETDLHGTTEMAATALRARLVDDLSASIGQLPLLLDLVVGLNSHAASVCPCSWLSVGEPHSFFRRLAAATQLRELQLDNLPLPATEASLLSSLQRLTALQLHHCNPCSDPPSSTPSPASFGWIASLTRLELFAWSPMSDAPLCGPDQSAQALPWPMLARLQHLETLAVNLAPGSVLPQTLVDLLVALRGQLTCLELWGSLTWGLLDRNGQVIQTAGECALLQALPGLEALLVLDVRDLDGWQGSAEQLQQQLRLPGRLRYCFVPEVLRGTPELQQLRAGYPQAAFREYDVATVW